MITADLVDESPDLTRRHIRQKRLVTALAILLVLGGITILAFLHRLPVPMRMMVGLGDIFIGCVLLVLVRQQGR